MLRIVNFLFVVFCICFMCFSYNQLFLFPYIETGDGLSLFNPIYMGKHYHRIVYPAYYYYTSMPVHPPVYYGLLSMLYSMGLPVFYVVKLPVFLSLAAFLVCIGASRLHYTAKFSALLALAVAIDRTGAYITFRPDVVLSVLFITSLLCLYNGIHPTTRRGWLFTGSILIGITSTLHYFGILGFLGLFFFARQLYKRETNTHNFKNFAYLLLPALIIVSVYLLFIILPNASKIYGEIAATALNKPQPAMVAHYKMYRSTFSNDPLLYALLLMPGALWIVLAALVNKKMSALYLASVPLILFVFFVPSGKTAGYYIVEWFMFFWVLYHVVLYAFTELGKKLPEYSRNALSIFALLLVIAYTVFGFNLDSHAEKVTIGAKPNGCEMETARACGKQILGNHAKVSGRLNAWYNTGAAHWLSIGKYTIYPMPLTNQTVKSVFEKFDAIAEYRQGAEVSYRPDKYSLPQWYADSTLHLKGFYLSNNYMSVPYNEFNDACWLLFSATKTDSVKGYMTYNNEAILKLAATAQTPERFFVSIIMPDTNLVNSRFDSLFIMYTKFVYPDVTTTGYKALVWGITRHADSNSIVSFLNFPPVVIRDFVPVKAEKINKATLLNYSDSTVKFYSGLSELQQNSPFY